MDYMRFPTWQTLRMDAVREFDSKKSHVRIDRAKPAALQRAEQLKNATNEDDERLAIRGPLKCLRFLPKLYRKRRPLRVDQ